GVGQGLANQLFELAGRIQIHMDEGQSQLIVANKGQARLQMDLLASGEVDDGIEACAGIGLRPSVGATDEQAVQGQVEQGAAGTPVVLIEPDAGVEIG